MTLIVVFLGLLLLLFVLDASSVSMHNEFYCYSTDPIRPLTRMHSTRSSYEAVRRRTSFDPNISSCTPSRFWFLGRHGGQFPQATGLQQMIDMTESSIQADIASNYYAGRTTLCRQDFEAIRDWTIDPNFIIDNANLATEASKIAMQNIARRYQQSYPTILTENYNPDRFHFRHTRNPPTNTSIRAFADSLFGENESENVIFENVPDNDAFLLPTHFCPALTEEVANQHQLDAFRRGPEFEEMMEQVNRKLGFYGSNQLSVDTVLVMWEWCRRETGDKFDLSDSEIGETVAWCAPFSISHNLLLEYHSDLSYFYLSGYGVRNQRLIENLNCGLVQDFLTHMQSNEDTDQTVRVFITNSQVLLALMVTFGSFQDTWPLHQHNFALQINRHWLTSLITPRAGNVAVVRYDCVDGDHDLLFLLNESPLLIPGCGTENGICKLSFILNRFQRFIDANCEELFCSSN